MFGGYLPSGHHAFYAVLQIGFLLLTDKLRIVRRLLVLQGPVDNHIGLGRPLKPQTAVRPFGVKPHAGKIIGVISHHKLLIGVPPSPFVVGHARGSEHLVLPLLPLDGHLQAGIGKRGRALRKHPEHVHHVVNGHLGGLLVHAPLIHVYPPLAGGGVLALVPFLPCGGIGRLEFFQSVQTVLVGFDKLYIGLARRFPRRHVLTRKPPVLMKHLHLKPSEHAFYRLRLAIVGLCGAVHLAYLADKAVVVELLVTALVVIHNLPRLVTALLHRHAVGVILRLVVFRVADAVAQQHLAHGVNHLIHLSGPYLALLVPIVEVQFRAVTIP